MTRNEAIKILKEHQKWRRGLPPYDETCGMPYDPKEVGAAIDYAIDHLEDDDTWTEEDFQNARPAVEVFKELGIKPKQGE